MSSQPTSRARASITVDSMVWDTAVLAASRHSDLELEVVSLVLANPLRAVPLARRSGATPSLFLQYDLRLIWCGCEVAFTYPVECILRLVRRALKEDAMWDAKAPSRSRNMRWSDASLVSLAIGDLHRYSDDAVGYAVRNLLHIHGEMMSAQRHHDAAIEAMKRAAGFRELPRAQRAKAG